MWIIRFQSIFFHYLQKSLNWWFLEIISKSGRVLFVFDEKMVDNTDIILSKDTIKGFELLKELLLFV